MGIGLFAPPIGLGLLGCCLIGNVKLEDTLKPLFGYLGLLLVCVIVIALLPADQRLAAALPGLLIAHRKAEAIRRTRRMDRLGQRLAPHAPLAGRVGRYPQGSYSFTVAP